MRISMYTTWPMHRCKHITCMVWVAARDNNQTLISYSPRECYFLTILKMRIINFPSCCKHSQDDILWPCQRLSEQTSWARPSLLTTELSGIARQYPLSRAYRKWMIVAIFCLWSNNSFHYLHAFVNQYVGGSDEYIGRCYKVVTL